MFLKVMVDAIYPISSWFSRKRSLAFSGMILACLCSFLFGAGIVKAAEGNPNAQLDRPYTLRNFTPRVLEAEYHRMIIESVPQSFIFPRPCRSELDSSQICLEKSHFQIRITKSDSNGEKMKELSISPLGGYEYRYIGENAHSGSLGLISHGFLGPVSFFLDARMYTEQHDKWNHPSFDGEGLDRQDGKASGSVAYSSFSRYRSNVSYDWAWGRLTAGRDAVHWGPALFSNLVFHQNAIPFNQLTFTTHLGPVSVQSLYGQLIIGDDWESNTSTDQRHLYAHRYEWRITPNLLLGGSEQLILFKQSAPFAFMPMVPLFIAKYSEKERLNNGNLATDLTYRFKALGSVYSEFLLDDLQSPGSLFGDYWGNKWGWVAGMHYVQNLASTQGGAILEYSRVEPWVYTHYQPNSAQTANFNQPLGNQMGPNSQSFTGKIYLRGVQGWYTSLTAVAAWKGTDLGSSILDLHPDSIEKKSFLAGQSSPTISVSPALNYQWANFNAYLEASLGNEVRMVAGVQARY